MFILMSTPLIFLAIMIAVFTSAETHRKHVSIKAVDLPDAEYLALYDLYNSTNGMDWDWRNLTTEHIPWQFHTKQNPCTSNWEGVGCKIIGVPPQAKYTIIKINLSNRDLKGTLPSTMGALRNLASLHLPYNSINGTIPTSFGLLLQMEHCGLSSNSLSGTLPGSLSNWTSIQHFGFEHNQLTGTLPFLWTNASHINSLLLSDNHFVGTIPNEIGLLRSLVYLYLNHNAFRGIIPASLGNLIKLAYFDLDSNQLQGTIPESFAALTRLHFLGLHSNQLTGTIPSFIGSMSKLQFLYLNNEQFTGTIPDSLGHLSKLLFMHIQYNRLTGTIPESFQYLNKIQYLYLNNNQLKGTAPHVLSMLTDLNSLLLQSNALTGPLHGVFNHTVQLNLKTVQLSDNVFTGELPEELFLLPQLATLIAVSTCFHGSLPEVMCNATALETVVMDGLRSSASCQKILFPGINGRPDHDNTFRGKVPACLFNLTKLNTLHLSGNDLSGSLPGDLVVNERLLDLDLSHNTLTGPIPDTIQNKVWYNLDLSFNRLSGTMLQDFYAQPRNFSFQVEYEQFTVNTTELRSSAALSLSNNRLSGRIPGRVHELLNITILTANVFSCNYDKSDLPHHDSGELTYSCGSNSFDLPYITWLVVVGTVVLATGASWRYRMQLERHLHLMATLEKCRRWLAILDPKTETSPEVASKLGNVRYVAKVFAVIEKANLCCLAYILLVLLPLYAIEAEYYGTHTQQYAYSFSATFLSGVVPFALQFVCLASLLLLLIAGTVSVRDALALDTANMQIEPVVEVERVEGASPPPRRVWSVWLGRMLVRMSYFVINLVVVVGVNIAFVVVALYKSTVLLVVAQVLLSLFKVFWNLVCSPFLIRWTADYLHSPSRAVEKEFNTMLFSLQVFVSLFNNIAIPCFVVSVVDPNCFYNVFVPAEAQTSHYVYAVCKFYAFQGCLQVVPQVASASFHPPFNYSYQCSSSFITYYAPAFIYMCFVATFGSPLVQLAAQALLRSLPEDSRMRGVLSVMIPPVWVPINPMAATSTDPVQRRIFRPFFDGNLLISILITYMGVILTFGAVFPPLAAALALSLVVISNFAKLKIGMLLCAAIDTNQLVYLDIVQAECAGAGSLVKLRRALRFVVSFSGIFYTLFLFDALGNARGFSGAVWVIFVVPMTAPVIYVLMNTYSWVQQEVSRPLNSMVEEKDHIASTEMVDLAQRVGKENYPVVTNGSSGDGTVLSALHAEDV